MMKSSKIALCQLIPDYDKHVSLGRARDMIGKAAAENAELAILPEMFYHPYEILAILKKIGDEDAILEELTDCARSNCINVCTGSMAVRQDGKVYNRSYLIDTGGNVVLKYDKCHLFDVNLPQLRARESLVFTPGSEAPVVETTLGKIGIVICYDIRFPELVRSLTLKGAELLIVPAVFNNITGPAHWSIMMRARAIENQIFLAAVSQGRNVASSYSSYGHSMAVSPWGDVLCEASDDGGIIYAQIDAETLIQTRSRLPLLEHRRDDLYQKLYS
ncbi:MAG TPA: carbon-nitrogen hydrolase family protein [Chitinispirillaceae bacterium]|nr:carbon-nitrogen hydrolase family protein [Chitinispirillaceae bacterium]